MPVARPSGAGEVRTAGVQFATGEGRPPSLGEHTRAVLSELGYTGEQIEAMLAAGAAVD